VGGKVQGLKEVQQKLRDRQRGDKTWSRKLIQSVFEHFCVEFKAAPVTLT